MTREAKRRRQGGILASICAMISARAPVRRSLLGRGLPGLAPIHLTRVCTASMPMTLQDKESVGLREISDESGSILFDFMIHIDIRGA